MVIHEVLMPAFQAAGLEAGVLGFPTRDTRASRTSDPRDSRLSWSLFENGCIASSPTGPPLTCGPGDTATISAGGSFGAKGRRGTGRARDYSSTVIATRVTNPQDFDGTIKLGVDQGATSIRANQQDLSAFDIAIGVMVAPGNRLVDLRPLMPRVLEILPSASPTPPS